MGWREVRQRREIRVTELRGPGVGTGDSAQDMPMAALGSQQAVLCLEILEGVPVE